MVSLPQGFTMALKRRRATSPSSSVSGGDFDDNHTSSSMSSVGRKRRRTSNIPTVDPVILSVHLTIFHCCVEFYLLQSRDCLTLYSLSVILQSFTCRSQFVMSSTTQSEITRMTREGCCASCSSEPPNEGEEMNEWELVL